MKNRYILFTLTMLLMGACTEGTEMVLDDQGVNRWLHKTMEENYLWADKIPNINATDLNNSPYIYFDSYLRYRKDKALPSYSEDTFGDRFSRLVYLNSENSAELATAAQQMAADDKVNDFGFGVRTFVNYGGTVVAIQVIYVVPRSPADIAGIKRGERITKINSVAMPAAKGDVVSAMAQQHMKLTISYPVARSVELSRADYHNTPIIFDSIFDTKPKTAYLVYNHFTKGESDKYINELNNVFARFKQAGVESLILDLRYNGGGELEVARHLASLIAKKEMLGKVLIYKESRGSYGRSEEFSYEDFISMTDNMINSNIDARRVCIITSRNTASASELIMHALKPYYKSDMTIVGERSVGKNLGSIEITNKRYRWKIKPITLRVYNCLKISGYEKGIDPDPGRALTELTYNNTQIGGFGHADSEALVNSALNVLHPEAYALMGGTGYSSRGLQQPQIQSYTNVQERDLIVGRYEVDK